MKKFLFIALITLTQVLVAQEKGTIKGLLTDKETNNEPLPFVNVFIKGTTIGATTDFDGLYNIKVPAGTHTISFSFLGYKTINKSITIAAGEVLTINQVMAAEEGVGLDEVIVRSSSSKDKESALLLKQKKATIIVESIGAERLAKTGVSNASSATTKISGVSKSEGTGDIYVRGLGDRYLSTTMNGLPIPSDNVDNKNINLSLFSTNIIQNVGISKTYAASNYLDQASGNVNVETKGYTKKQFSISVSGGSNTNVIDQFGNFRRTIITDDVTLGFHQKQFAVQDLVTRQGWDTNTQNTPANYSISISGGRKFEVLGKELSVFATASHSKNYNYQTGIFQLARANIIEQIFSDVEVYSSNVNTSGYANLGLRLNDNHKIKLNSLFVAKSVDYLFEQGRNGVGFVFEQEPQEEGAFVRDQNYKQTLMFVNQALGEHKLFENNTLNWGAGYNFILAEEPNRIRNEVSILNNTTVQYANNSAFQQRKSSQRIQDSEVNAFLKDSWSLGEADEDDNLPFTLNLGVNYRHKERNFRSLFIGVDADGFQVPTVDDISSTFTTTAFNNGLRLIERPLDRYNGTFDAIAGFADFDFAFNKLTGNFGLRFERDEFFVEWDVANFQGRTGSLNRDYNNLNPSLNLKFELNDRNFIRFASSISQTLPEFKEFAPFEYVSPTGRVTKGNPDIERSNVYNTDLKWEFFPSREELISVTAFYKNISDPINLAQTRGSAGIFQFNNTGEEANIFGVELEGRVGFLENEDEENLLNLTGNITQMWLKQDLLVNFQYNNKTESSLQGASDFIINGALTYSDKKEKEFTATLTGNYSSDKIFALGNPESFASSDTLFNEEIIEKGFVTLDLVLSKQITEKLSARFIGRNLLNPSIRQTQDIRDLNMGAISTATVLEYKKGSQISLNFKYTF
ncbi:TonB-dependent receptor [uncultured Polaribacter sp.]|uniref:TonB-dependent receptor n=1 Tax=uncultured Polaribacter sp. TaxID=174711 RepID=UPI00260FD931|nr:TonB-dependent receptor [uncultured Polaribacter sp.]